MPKLEPMQQPPSRGGRRSRVMRVSTSLAEINVVPLVDVMLVLLVIFMVAAPMLQQGMEVNLPVSARSDEIPAARMFVDVPMSYRENKRVYLDKEPVSLQFLAERVKQATMDQKQPQLFIRSDGELRVQDLIDVLGELKAAGVQAAGIVTKQP